MLDRDTMVLKHLFQNPNKFDREDEQATDILERTTKKVGEYYETAGLQWKSDNIKFPLSYDNALKRLKTIENKMEKDPNFHKKYTEKIDDYLEKGYIQRLTLEETENFTDLTY